MTDINKLFGSWAEPLSEFLESPEFRNIGKTLKKQSEAGENIFPLFDKMFRAFKLCPWDEIKVVILTNNPYIDGECDGMALSASKDPFLTPKCLRVVFDEIENQVMRRLYLNRDPDLSRWAKQGILLLNCDLSGIKGKRAAHIELWKPFIEFVIRKIDTDAPGTIFVLLGAEAEKYKFLITSEDHDLIILEHPMKAVVEKRDWNSHNLFLTLNKACNLIFGEKIVWVHEIYEYFNV